jgi:hypothetical protein
VRVGVDSKVGLCLYIVIFNNNYMSKSLFTERVLDTRVYEFINPVTLRPLGIQEQIVEIQELDGDMDSNLKRTQVAVEHDKPIPEPKNWLDRLFWCCGTKPEEEPQKMKRVIHVDEPYISPLRLYQREKKPWTTYNERIAMGPVIKRGDSLFS